MKAISIRQPWAWLIVNGFKDIENRSWDTKYRGLVLIHASKHKPKPEEWDEARRVAKRMLIDIPPFASMQTGGIVGYTYITGTTRESPSLWFFGPVGFQLHGSKPLPFLPMKGRLSFFETGYGLAAIENSMTLIREFNVPGVNT